MGTAGEVVLQSGFELPLLCPVVVCLPHRRPCSFFRLPYFSISGGRDAAPFRGALRAALLRMGLPLRAGSGCAAQNPGQEVCPSRMGIIGQISCFIIHGFADSISGGRIHHVFLLPHLSGCHTAGLSPQSDFQWICNRQRRHSCALGRSNNCDIFRHQEQPVILQGDMPDWRNYGAIELHQFRSCAVAEGGVCFVPELRQLLPDECAPFGKGN